jgi:hypothetical protein
MGKPMNHLVSRECVISYTSSVWTYLFFIRGRESHFKDNCIYSHFHNFISIFIFIPIKIGWYFSLFFESSNLNWNDLINYLSHEWTCAMLCCVIGMYIHISKHTRKHTWDDDIIKNMCLVTLTLIIDKCCSKQLRDIILSNKMGETKYDWKCSGS